MRPPRAVDGVKKGNHRAAPCCSPLLGAVWRQNAASAMSARRAKTPLGGGRPKCAKIHGSDLHAMSWVRLE